jgi:hypothetical protein
MASLTINDVKDELINSGIELSPSSAKKISGGEKDTIDFSSDEDEHSLPIEGKISKKKVSRKSEGMSGINHKAKAANSNGQEVKEGDLTEENSLVVGDIDVSKLTDEELAEKLIEFNIAAGPVVESTRTVYQKKLAISMRESMKIVTTIDDTVSDVEENNNLSETYNANDDAEKDELKDAEFSADDEDDPYQPSCVNVSTSECSISTISNNSPLSLRIPSEDCSSFTKIHQRLSGANKEASVFDASYLVGVNASSKSRCVTTINYTCFLIGATQSLMNFCKGRTIL